MKTYNLAEKIIDRNDLSYLISWLKTNPRLTMDQLTIEFEKLWAKWIGTKYAVFCNSGSSANLLMVYSLLLSGKLRNKKVIVPSVGWVTTVAPFIQFGYEPVMCGANSDDFGLDLDELERILKKHNPSAVAMVQVLGVPGNMDGLKELQRKYHFYLLEDACAALGAEYGGKKVGTFGEMSSFSFYFGHQLSTIEGGMVNTDNEDLYNLLIMLRSHGWLKDLSSNFKKRFIKKYQIDTFHEPFTFIVPGFNVRPTEINAFLGLEMMKKADKISEIRKRNHLIYADKLKNVSFQRWNRKAVPCSISFGAVAKDTDHRKKIVKALVKSKIETRLFSAGNLGLHPFWFERYGKFHNEVADKIHYCGFFLPNNESLNEKDTLYICKVVNNI